MRCSAVLAARPNRGQAKHHDRTGQYGASYGTRIVSPGHKSFSAPAVQVFRGFAASKAY
jgi:hypothetical protein